MLSHATRMSFKASVQVEAAKLLEDITTSTPTRASEYKKKYSRSHKRLKIYRAKMY